MFKPVQFGKYYLSERIAVGGMAEIYKAKLYGVSGFEKPMVVKQILPQYARNAEFIKMFIDEAKISVSLSHGNIIPVYELGRIDGIYFIAMEYVQGKNLSEILEASQAQGMPIPSDHAIFIAIEICKGLDYAHRRADDQGSPLGVVHRDISPPNVMVTMAGEVKVADFGIAKATDKLGVTDVGVVKGSYGYMSPEQIQGFDLDHRTDIFNTGILLHEMVTGRKLFDGSEATMVEKIKNGIITLPSMVAPEAPVELDPVILQALAKNPDDRFKDANQFQLELSRILFSTGAGATSATLSGYMRKLFPSASTPTSQEVVVDAKPPTQIDGPAEAQFKVDTATRNSTQSYAVRAEFEDISMPDGSAARDRGHSVMSTAPAAQSSEATMMLPTTTDPAFGAPSDSSPIMPEVPELRANARVESDMSGPAKALADALAVPSKPAEAFAEAAARSMTPPQAQDDAPVAPLPDPDPPSEPDRSLSSPDVVVGEGRKKGPRSDASVMALLLPGDESGANTPAPDVSLLPPSQDALSQTATSFPTDQRGPQQEQLEPSTGQIKRPKRPSGVFSSTMQLFVLGLEEEDEALDEIPRTIKPTILGWLLILALVGAAAFFVVYKKTNLFKKGGDQALIGIDDIKPPKTGSAHPDQGAEKRKQATVKLTVEPKTALVFRYLGDAPATLDLAPKTDYLLVANRDGYRTIYKTASLKTLGDSREIKLVTSPLGAGGSDVLPTTVPAPPTTAGSIKATVKSDPAGASIWLFVGQGNVTLSDSKRQRYDFKVMAKGFETGIISISASRFQATGEVSESVKLTAKGATAAKPAPQKAAKETVAKKKPARKTTKSYRPKRRKKRRRPKKKKMLTPSWAR